MSLPIPIRGCPLSSEIPPYGRGLLCPNLGGDAFSPIFASESLYINDESQTIKMACSSV